MRFYYDILDTLLSKSASYLFGLVALFAYVAAQTGVNSFFINYVTEASSTITNQ